MVGLKKKTKKKKTTVTHAKISPKMVSRRDIAGNAEEEVTSGTRMTVKQAHRSRECLNKSIALAALANQPLSRLLGGEGVGVVEEGGFSGMGEVGRGGSGKDDLVPAHHSYLCSNMTL